MHIDLVRRQSATEKTLAKYGSRPFDWRKRATCLHLAQYHMKAMGHKPPRVPPINSLVAAKKMLKKHEWDDVAAMLDSLLPRIEPAEMLLGDLAATQSADGCGAIVVNAGHKMLGWHDEVPCIAPLIVSEYIGAWRL